MDLNGYRRTGAADQTVQGHAPVAPGAYHPYGAHTFHGGSPGFFEQSDPLSPVRIFRYVLKYHGFIACMMATGVLCGVIVTLMQTPKYEATAKLEIRVPTAKVLQYMEAVDESNDLRAFLTTREELKSRALAQKTVYKLGLAEKPDFLFPSPAFALMNILHKAFGQMENKESLADYTPERREQIAINRILDNLSVTLLPNTSLLELTFHDQNPAYARDVANQLAASYIDQRVEQMNETSTLARQFIQEQVVQVKDRLQASEQALVDYAKASGLTVDGDDGSLIMKNIEASNTALSSTIQERLDYDRLLQQIDAGHGASLPQVLDSKPLETLRDKIAELRADYQQRLGIFKPGFPEMQRLEARIKELEKQLAAGVETIANSMKLKHREIVLKESDLRKKLGDLQKQQLAFQDKNIEYTILKREVTSNRAQYESLMNKLNEVSVVSELKNRNAAVIDPAVLPQAPYSPRLPINLGIVLALFAAVSAAAIYFREFLNNTFGNPDQVEEELKLPVLGIFPSVRPAEIASALADRQSALSEAYRSLRTSLQRSSAHGHPRTLLITSAELSEGKTTTAFKLALEFAALDMSVLIVDADMRRPDLHRKFACDNTVGLSNLLGGEPSEAEIEKIFRTTQHKNVTLITAGPLPHNPADLLASGKMALALEAFAKRYDMVIIDAPPVIGLADVPILSRYAEAMLLVVSAHQVTRNAAKAALKRIRAAGGSVVGAALLKLSLNQYDHDYRYMSDNYYAYVSHPLLEDHGKSGSEKAPASLDGIYSGMRAHLHRLFKSG